MFLKLYFFKVNWQHRVSTYWVRFIHIELLGFPPSLPTPSVIKVGDRVRVKSNISTPRYKWGYVTHESVGVVTGKHHKHVYYFF